MYPLCPKHEGMAVPWFPCNLEKHDFVKFGINTAYIFGSRTQLILQKIQSYPFS